MRKFVSLEAVAVALPIGAPSLPALTLDPNDITANSDAEVAGQLSVEVASAFVGGAAVACLRGIGLSAAAGR